VEVIVRGENVLDEREKEQGLGNKYPIPAKCGMNRAGAPRKYG
jgi:hypothetical protein